ncbi:MAG: hypothetical protein NTX14_00760 [Candidatus Nealsonbacteria bacterium]|nr:hypothetical protein [Candidatus Nealsonbacteria bacterium]
MFKVTYFGFNEDDTKYSLEKIRKIEKAICTAACCEKDSLIFVLQPTYNGKRHIELLPLDESSGACEKAAKAIFAEGFNVILLPAPLVYCNKVFEKK